MVATLPQTSRRRWLQWSLRSIFVLMTACAVIMGTFVVRSRNERELNAYFAGACAKLTIEPSGPSWLRRVIGDQFFEHVVGIEWFEFGLPPRGEGQEDFDVISLSEDDAARLCRLPKLRTLDLRGLRLTDESLSRLDELPAIERLSLGEWGTCSVAAVERLADNHPDWDIDLAFAEHLYHLTAEEHRSGKLNLRDAILSVQIAERWKLACAKCKDDVRAETAAREQHARWLGEIQKRVEELAKINAPDGGAEEVDLIHCAVCQSRLALAHARHDDAAVAAIDGASEAERLVASFDTAMNDGSVDLYAMTLGWPLAADLLLKAGESGSDCARSVLRRQVEAFRHLVAWLEPLWRAGDRRGTAEAMRLVRVSLALADAQFARAQNDLRADRGALERAETDARELRMAACACYEMGTMRLDEFVFDGEMADTLQFELARARSDRGAEQAVADASAELLAAKVLGLKYMCRMGPDMGASQWDQVLRTASAIAQLRVGGADSFAVNAANFSFWSHLQKLADEAANTADGEFPEMEPGDEGSVSDPDEELMPLDMSPPPDVQELDSEVDNG